MEFHRDGLESSLLDFQLGPEQFLLVLVLHAHQLLLLAVLSTLVEEKRSDNKTYQQERQCRSNEDDYIDFLVLRRHKKAIINDKYSKIPTKSRTKSMT